MYLLYSRLINIIVIPKLDKCPCQILYASLLWTELYKNHQPLSECTTLTRLLYPKQSNCIENECILMWNGCEIAETVVMNIKLELEIEMPLKCEDAISLISYVLAWRWS